MTAGHTEEEVAGLVFCVLVEEEAHPMVSNTQARQIAASPFELEKKPVEPLSLTLVAGPLVLFLGLNQRARIPLWQVQAPPAPSSQLMYTF